ncbi:MAG: STAS domain-containing protein [Sedimentisphaerales bacterium]|nr:STAS domain-containing protein [Sedimentisphaerales bacterium]
MQVTVSKEGAVTLVKPVGPIVAGELDELERQLNQLNRSWTKRLVIEMGEVTFCDSSGLELIVKNQREMAERGLKLKLSNLNDMTQEIFDITRLSARFEIFPDVVTAVRSFL